MDALRTGAISCSAARLLRITAQAKTTIEVLVANLVCPLIMNKIFFKNYRDLNAENTIKLLYRARILYEAREQVTAILKAVVQIEATMTPKGAVWRIL